MTAGYIKAIRDYFGEGKHGRKVEIQEIKDLSPSDREELGELCLRELQIK